MMTLPTETESSGQRSQLTVHEKLQAISTLAHQWSVHLSGAECKLLLWLFGNTILRGKRSGTYSVSQLVSGVRKADRSGYWCGGTGLAERTIQYAIKSLRTRGVIFTRSGDKGISFVINLKWSTSGELPADIAKTDCVRGSVAEIPQLGSPEIRNQVLGGGAKVTPREVQNLHPFNRKTFQEENQERTTTASGDGGVVPAGEKIQGIFSRVKATHSALREEAPNNAFGYKQTWDRSFSEHHPGLPVGWTIKDAGMIKRALANWPDMLGSRHDFIGWSVEHWKEVVRAKFGWMTRNPAPATPVASFFAHYIRAFMDAWCDAETLRWAGNLPGTEARYQQLRHLGMSHDAATLEVAKEQAMAADRQKRAANLRAAKRTLQLAQEVAKRATTRFTADNPHPRARENVRMAPPRLVEGQDGSFVPRPLPKFDFDA